MAQLSPTALRVISPPWVDRVPAPAHDSLTPAERRRYLAGNPDSYLTVTRSPEDAEPGEPWDPEAALERSTASLRRLVDEGAFGPLTSASLYLYELSFDGHTQVGVVGGVATEDYEQGTIRIHERIRDDRADHLATQLGGLGVQSSPIAVAYRPNETIDGAIAQVVGSEEPMVDFEAIDGVRQRVWRIEDEVTGDRIRTAIGDLPLYLIDGHHRAAATAKLRRGSSGSDTEWILAAAFSARDLLTEAFHRCLPGADGAELLSQLEPHLAIRTVADRSEVLDRGPDEVALLLPANEEGSRWHLVTLPPPSSAGTEAQRFLATLEPVRLEQVVLQPILGIETEAAGGRIAFLHGRADADDLARLEAESTDPVWVMRPITVDSVMAASDLGAVMPPKSTYFRPKVRSGVFLRPIRTATDEPES